MEVVCIGGIAQSGKDTLANCLEKLLINKGKKVLIIHHADYLKFVCKQYFDWDGQKDDKGRTILQYVGTDIVRVRKPDFWVEIVQLFLSVFNQDYDFILIPDCRFPNEIESYKNKYHTTSIRMHRPNFDNGLSQEQKSHKSETALDDYSFDITLNCSSGIENVMASAKTLLEEVFNI
jgi:hypothetical protein